MMMMMMYIYTLYIYMYTAVLHSPLFLSFFLSFPLLLLWRPVGCDDNVTVYVVRIARLKGNQDTSKTHTHNLSV